MPKYRKKPVVIDAVRNNGLWGTTMEWLDSLTDDNKFRVPFGAIPPIRRNPDGSLDIDTLEGTMRAEVGDWIICGVKGELYPCKADIFFMTYDLEENNEQ